MKLTHIKTGNTYELVTLANTTADKGNFLPTIVYKREGHTYARPLDEFLAKFSIGFDIGSLSLYSLAAKGNEGEFIKKQIPLQDDTFLTITCYASEGKLTRISASRTYLAKGVPYQYDVGIVFDSRQASTSMGIPDSLYELAIKYL